MAHGVLSCVLLCGIIVHGETKGEADVDSLEVVYYISAEPLRGAEGNVADGLTISAPPVATTMDGLPCGLGSTLSLLQILKCLF